jgi:hypothetical protein
MARTGARLKPTPCAEVDNFTAQLAHPHKPAIEAIRQVVRGAGLTASTTMHDLA